MKAVALGLVFSICSFALLGQISFGVKGGINFNNIETGEFSNNFGTAIGFHMGAYGKLKLTKNLSLIPELQFSQRGTKIGSESLNVNYIELPILFSYSIKNLLSVDLGVNPSYKASKSLLVDKDFDFGAIGGLEFQLTERFTAIGRYYYGLSIISEIELSNGSNAPIGIESLYNRTIQFGISYKIK
jgi:hypothetical protein